MDRPVVHETVGPEWASLKPLSWSSIIAGSIVAITIGALLNALGIGLGLSAFTTNESGVTTFAFGGILWLLVSTFLAMLIGGLLAGMLVRGTYKSFGGSLHGFLVWSLASLLSLILIGSVAVPTVAGIAQGAASNPALASSTPDIREESSGYLRRGDTTYNPRSDTISTSTTKQKAINVAGGISLVSFFALLLGLLGAILGGHVGVKKYDRDTYKNI